MAAAGLSVGLSIAAGILYDGMKRTYNDYHREVKIVNRYPAPITFILQRHRYKTAVAYTIPPNGHVVATKRSKYFDF